MTKKLYFERINMSNIIDDWIALVMSKEVALEPCKHHFVAIVLPDGVPIMICEKCKYVKGVVSVDIGDLKDYLREVFKKQIEMEKRLWEMQKTLATMDQTIKWMASGQQIIR